MMTFAALLTACVLAPTLSVRVDGEGWLRFERDGRAVYAKDATLVVKSGRLCHASGPSLLPAIEVSASSLSLTVDLEGTVSSGGPTIGRLVLASFPGDVRLIESGAFLVAAERPKLLNPGEGAAGVIRLQGASAPAKPKPNPAPTPAPTPAPAPVTAGQLTIKVRDLSEVDGDKILLSAIADLSGPTDLAAKAGSLELGPAPYLGISRAIDRTLIEARLKAAGFKEPAIKLDWPTSISVMRRHQKLTHADFVKAAIDFAKEKLPTAILEDEQTGPVMHLPLGEVKLINDGVATSNDRVSVIIAAYVDGKKVNSRTVLLKNSSQVLALKPGQAIKVTVRSGGAAVIVEGRVKTINARTGEVIVQTATGANLTGRLAADGTIEVKL